MIETRNVYEQLLELCQEQLSAGRWDANERFPSERELSQEHRISRATANKVLSKLVSEGWLEMRKGLGTFVAERPTLMASLRELESFTSFARTHGFKAETRLTEFECGVAGEGPVGAALGLDPTSAVVRVVRFRFADAECVIHEERWLPQALYPDLQAGDLSGSFYKLCRERYGLEVVTQCVQIAAANCPAAEELGWTAPALAFTGPGFDAEGRALWFQRLHYRGDRFAVRHQGDRAGAFPKISLEFIRNS